MLPHLWAFCCLQWSLMQEVIRFPISQWVRKPIPPPPKRIPTSLERPQVGLKVQTQSNSGRTEEAGTRDFSHGSVVGHDHSWGTAGRERGVGGRVMLCERMQRVGLSSSCPRVYWSVIALRGGGRSPAPALPSITRGLLQSAQRGHG